MGSPQGMTDRIEAAGHADRPTQAVCPACGEVADAEPLEIFHGVSRYACAGCDLHFWHPVAMPNAVWYETAYQGRDRTAMSLEPGHRFFLADPKAPRHGRLLDLGCGTGNFLAAARNAGFDVTGVEFDSSAVRFAREHYGLRRVFAQRPEDFRAAHPQEQFDVVTFFEVLEHQEHPRQFLSVAKDCLAAGGFLALSVPNRDRWQKGVESLDYPPNHLTRWSPRSLRIFLERNGFEILSLRQEPLGIRRAAGVLSMGLTTGLATRVAGERPPTLTDLAEMSPDEMQRAMKRLSEHRGHRLAAVLAHWKNLAMTPLAALLLPYLRLRGYTGLYLYCLARRKHQPSRGVAGAATTLSGAA
ncbi:MAG: class I SAM-dependent methyltransferase [Candidatus Acidiferrales bacterium]